MKPFYFFVGLILLLVNSFSQTGPGGVGNQTNNRLWISVDAVDQANGSTIQSLPDLSGNGNNVSQSVVSRRPIYTSSVLNGFPVATLNGNQLLLSNTVDNSIQSQNITMFTVFRMNNQTNQMASSIAYQSNNWVGTYSNTSTSHQNRIASVHRYLSFKSTLSTPIANNYVIHDINIAPTQMRTFINGSINGVWNATYQAPLNHVSYGIGGSSFSTTYRLKGEFAEAIVFNTTLTNTQRIIVENYLSSKYDLPIANDFYAAETSGHYYEVFGIGQVGGQPHSEAKGTGIVTLFNPTSLSDNEFLLCGHDDIGFNLNDVDVPPSYITNLGSRFTQTWRVSKTGDLGLVDIAFDLTDIAFGNPDNYQLLISPAASGGVFSGAAQHTTGVNYDPVTSTLTFTGVNFTDGDYFTIGNSDPFIISVQDGNWNNPLTWNCSCVPNSTHFVTIDDNTDVTLDVNAQVESITVNPLGVFNLSNGNIELARFFTVEGILNPDNGTVEFNGVAAVQNFTGAGQTTSLNNVIINKTSGVVNLSNITTELNGTLSILAGSFDVTAANFIVNSTSSTANGNIGPLSADALIGNITVRRFIPAGTAGYRDLSSPLVDIPLSQWDDNFSMSGPGFPDGCAWTSEGCYSSVKYYENDTWFDVTSYSHTLSNGRGYYVYLGNDLVSFAGTTIDVTGAVHTGSVVRNTTTGWSLVGNPFASNLDFNSLNRTGSIGNYFYVYDSDIGNYQWYDGASGTAGSLSGGLDDLQSGVIALGQGFWIDGGGSITMSQNAKVSTTTNFLRTSGEETSGFSLIISSNDSPYKCDAAFYFDQNASPYFDASDIRHLKSLNENAPYIASVTNNQELRLNKFNNEEATLMFPLITNVPDNQIYTIKVEDIDNFREYRCVYIIDYKTGEVYDLRSISEFTFEAEEIKSNQARFVLVLTQDECEEKVNQTLATSVNAIQEDQISFIQNGREVQINFDLLADKNVDIEIVNTLGQVVASTNNVEAYKNTVTMNVPSHSKGMHLIRIISTEGQIVKKIVVQ